MAEARAEVRRLARLSVDEHRLPLRGSWAVCADERDEPPDDAARWLLAEDRRAALAGVRALASEASGPPADQRRWWLRCRFDLPSEAPSWILRFDGLATDVTVWLDGRPLATSGNQFRALEIELAAPTLHARGNELFLRVDPLSTRWAGRRSRPRWRTPMVKEQGLRWARTTLLGRTPGWSPSTPPIGPWREVWLCPVQSGLVRHLSWHAALVGDVGRLSASLRLDDPAILGGLRLAVRGAGAVCVGTGWTAMGEGAAAATVEVPDVRRWWPHTHGEPFLYEVGLVDAGGAWLRSLGRVGFRTVELDTADGGFALRVNGEPLFARGACWMPDDVLGAGAGDDALVELLARMRRAGANLIRIPGPTVYEREPFWEACDTLGLLVWQDLMFANFDYPDEPAFLDEVREEVTEQARLWQGRPSLAVVCGNSEVEQQAAMWGAEREHWSPQLFHRQVPDWLAAVLPDTPYWPSSAHGGAFPFQVDEGTCSYYGVGCYGRPLHDATTSGVRFATEALAFANIPDDNTIAELREAHGGLVPRVHTSAWKDGVPRDLGAGWDFDDVRDAYVEQRFGERADTLRAYDPARHLMLGRAAVAEVMAAAFQQWRRPGSRCAGALVWTMRDLVAGAGWGILDHRGRPKSAFFALAEVWQPVHLGLTDEGLNGAWIHLVNETPVSREGTLTVRALREGQIAVAEASVSIEVAPRQGVRRAVVGLLPSFLDLTWSYRFGPPAADALVACWTESGGASQTRVLHLPQPGPMCRHELGLTARATIEEDGSRTVAIRCARLARAVHVEVEGWVPDRGFFDLVPGETAEVRLQPAAGPRRTFRAQVQAVNALRPTAVTGGVTG